MNTYYGTDDFKYLSLARMSVLWFLLATPAVIGCSQMFMFSWKWFLWQPPLIPAVDSLWSHVPRLQSDISDWRKQFVTKCTHEDSLKVLNDFCLFHHINEIDMRMWFHHLYTFSTIARYFIITIQHYELISFLYCSSDWWIGCSGFRLSKIGNLPARGRFRKCVRISRQLFNFFLM